jgi:hypothetical protein
MPQKFPPTKKPTLEEVQEQFEAWRKASTSNESIPTELLNAAASLCGRGTRRPYLIAQKLGLNYKDLKQHLVNPASAPPMEKAPAQTAFVELDLGNAPLTPECRVEMQDEKGGQFKFHIKGQPCPDLIAVLNAFWRKGS